MFTQSWGKKQSKAGVPRTVLVSAQIKVPQVALGTLSIFGVKAISRMSSKTLPFSLSFTSRIELVQEATKHVRLSEDVGREFSCLLLNDT